MKERAQGRRIALIGNVYCQGEYPQAGRRIGALVDRPVPAGKGLGFHRK